MTDTFDEDGLPENRAAGAYAQYYRSLPQARAAVQVAPQRQAPRQAATPFREMGDRDIAAYDRYEQMSHVNDTVRLIRQDESRLKLIERLRDTNYAGYIDSVWPEVYAKMTGADAEAKERTRNG